MRPGRNTGNLAAVKVTQRLFPLPAADQATLPPRQREALAILKDAYPDGLTAHQLGRDFTRPEWASGVGMAVGRALKVKGLVRERRGGVFFAVMARPVPDPDVDPFPEDF